jgi:hypothetical protein
MKSKKRKKARKAQAMLGHPTDRSMISNCPVTANAVKNAHKSLALTLQE